MMMGQRIIWLVAVLLIIGGSATFYTSLNKTQAMEQQVNISAHTVSSIEIEHKQITDKTDSTEKKEQVIVDQPVAIRIPSLAIDAPIIHTGLNDQGEMVVPDNGEEVAWFELGRMPGANGNSVLAGHVDDYQGPAVFFQLENIEIGAEVIIEGDNEETLTFVVERIEAYPYDDAPIREIFGPTDEKRLNLLTCTGLYNQSMETHEERLAVYTVLKE
ncbi:class F sortase [Gracilibacillus massiliensis]|uniref:class F sortase n=1 Tax=Gracilibacillus massiliensis TaxID=1564956 RepID=UPI00071CB4C5|nr:class F sortase [Gracilibacillus massiliensis]